VPNGTNQAFFGTPFADSTKELFTEQGLAGNDILEGDSGDDYLQGFDGIDQIKGEVGNDTLVGDLGSDSIFGGADNDSIFGGLDNDYLEGGSGNDNVDAGLGNDTIYGDNAGYLELGPEGNDSLFGNEGNDLIYGEGGDDTVDGSLGNDTIFGEAGNDLLFGGENDDVVHGGLGNDTIYGDAGSDILIGGSGADVFVFQPSNDFQNGYVDTITDFDVNEDRIDLSAFDLGVTEGDPAQNNGANQFAFDDFSNGLTQGLESAFYQVGSDVYIGSRPELGYGQGSLSGGGEGSGLNESSIIIENVNIDDLGGSNFIYAE